LKRVIVAGASGLIGSELIKLLTQDERIGEVVALVRRPLAVHSKLHQVSVDYDSLDEIKPDFYGDALYCCLGTTKNKTPDLNDSRRIDFNYPVSLAKMAEGNVGQFHLVSALGANTASPIFYNRIKGETEQAISRFNLPAIHIYQPSLLTGNRKEKRPFEKIAIASMKLINPFLIGSFKRYRSIEAKTVAEAMLKQTFKELSGIHTYPSHIIKQLA
jgi:uncharacterized protein YbjT (DUF2867 family)